MNTAFLFDLDGTLMDSVYQHVLAWREALEEVGLELSVWRIHRRIGMSGGLFLDALLRETGRRFGLDEAAAVRRTHATAFARLVGAVKPLPGARDLLKYLTNAKVPWAIATSGWLDSARPMLKMLDVPDGVRPSRARQTRPRFVSRGRRATRRADRFVHRRRRQRVGSARRTPRARVGCRTLVGRVRTGRAGARGSVPRL